jgi:hypothetical protein
MIVICSAGTFHRVRFFLIIRDTEVNIASADLRKDGKKGSHGYLNYRADRDTGNVG